MHLLSTIHPTQNQLRVLAKIIIAQHKPMMAIADISDDINLISARNMLSKLNLITFSDTSATITDKGMQVAQDNDIADESGQITDIGSKLASTLPDGKPDNNTTSPEAGVELPSSLDLGSPNSMGMESFSVLFKNLING